MCIETPRRLAEGGERERRGNSEAVREEQRQRAGKREQVKEKEAAEGLCGCVCVHVKGRRKTKNKKDEKVAGKAKVTFINAVTLCCALTSPSTRISLYHSHSDVPNSTN